MCTRNAIHHPSFHVEVTLHDEMVGLKEEYVHLCTARDGRDVAAWEDTKAYDKTTTNETLKQEFNTLTRFDDRLIALIGKIMLAEKPEEVADLCRKNGIGDQSSDTVCTYIDCRVNKRFITVLFKSSTVFMRAQEDHGETGLQLQHDTMYRAEHVFRQKG